MNYVIKRRKDGMYVSRPGSKHSYTNALQNARTYPTLEAAKADACENEYVLSVDDAMGEG